MRKKVVDIVEDLVKPFLQSNHLELVDIEFVKEGPYRYLRVIVDKTGGVSLDDCALVSRFLNKKLDEVDPIEEHYYLEVTSPGVERPIKRKSDFERFSGQWVLVNLFAPLHGSKVFKGILRGLEGNSVLIEKENQGIIKIPRDKISLLKLQANFDILENLDDSDLEEQQSVDNEEDVQR